MESKFKQDKRELSALGQCQRKADALNEREAKLPSQKQEYGGFDNNQNPNGTEQFMPLCPKQVEINAHPH